MRTGDRNSEPITIATIARTNQGLEFIAGPNSSSPSISIIAPCLFDFLTLSCEGSADGVAAVSAGFVGGTTLTETEGPAPAWAGASAAAGTGDSHAAPMKAAVTK
jgi:hypothetical protein